MGDREHRKKKLSAEQKWQIFLEASRKNTTDAEVCRRWGIAPHQLRVIRERVKDGAFDAFKKGPGRPKRDPEVVELESGCAPSHSQGTDARPIDCRDAGHDLCIALSFASARHRMITGASRVITGAVARFRPNAATTRTRIGALFEPMAARTWASWGWLAQQGDMLSTTGWTRWHDRFIENDMASTRYQFAGTRSGPTKWPPGAATSWVKCVPYQTTTSWPWITWPLMKLPMFAS